MLCPLTKPMVRRNIFTKEKPGCRVFLEFSLVEQNDFAIPACFKFNQNWPGAF